MMHLAYSALAPSTRGDNQNLISNRLIVRYRAHQAVCEKYKQEIAAIRKYFPNWQPNFNY